MVIFVALSVLGLRDRFAEILETDVVTDFEVMCGSCLERQELHSIRPSPSVQHPFESCLASSDCRNTSDENAPHRKARSGRLQFAVITMQADQVPRFSGAECPSTM